MRVRMTRHAIERAAEMGVPIDRIEKVATRPHVTYGGSRRDDSRVASRSDEEFALVIDPTTSPVTVVTVLVKTQERYVRA